MICEEVRRESRHELAERLDEELLGWALLECGSSSWPAAEIIGDEASSLVGITEI